MEMTTEKAFEYIANSMFEIHSENIFSYIKAIELRLDELERTNKKSYLRQKEVFNEFGIGHTTLKRWVAKGLEEIWIENRVYYDRKDIERYMNEHRV